MDHRADIFSLGVVFYEMLTGELPLGKFAPPSRMVKMDVRLDEVVLHALEKEPERRYQQASQVKTDVETIARTEAGSGKSQPGRSEPAPAPAAAPGDREYLAASQRPGDRAGGHCHPQLVGDPFGLLYFAGDGGPGARSSAPPPVESCWCSRGLLLSGITLVAGLKMKRLEAYGLAIAGAVLAILLTPGNLVGLPIGIWALVVLSRREVREVFGKGYPLPRLAPAGGGRLEGRDPDRCGGDAPVRNSNCGHLCGHVRAGVREGAQQGQTCPSRSTVSSASPSCLSTGAA